MSNPLPALYSNGKEYNIPFKIGKKTGMSNFTSLIQHSTRSLTQGNQARRGNKRHPNWKENFFYLQMT